jgi:hypothetical protein
MNHGLYNFRALRPNDASNEHREKKRAEALPAPMADDDLRKPLKTSRQPSAIRR